MSVDILFLPLALGDKMIKICYFARLAEELDCREEMLDSGFNTVRDLVEILKQRGEPWQSTLSDGRLMVALNHTMASLDAQPADGDEIAFFPPVTGG
jgi:molybdopterin synthase sulfur carrier subunit